MKKKAYTIKINEPCGENWQAMTESQVGKFCSQCTKHVVDFSQLSDSEIISLIENSNGKLCGRFKQSQLDRVLTLSTKEQTNGKYKQILAGLLVLSNATSSFGATDKEVSQKINSEIKIENRINPIKDSLLLSFSGKIWNKNQNRGIQTTIWNDKISFNTNSNGEFSVNLNPNLFSDSIQFYFLNSNTEMNETFTISKSALPISNYIIEITSNEPLIVGKIAIEQPPVLIEEVEEPKLMGDVVWNNQIEDVVCEPIQLKKHWWQFWKRK